MKTLLCISILFLFFGCKYIDKKSEVKWKTIEVGDYLFDFPQNFRLIKEQGIDSYVGRIKGNDITFEFDFGFYSNDFEQTVDEYLKDGDWRGLIAFQFMKDGVNYDDRNMPNVEIMNIRPATAKDNSKNKKYDFVAECIYENSKFEYPISIPDDIKNQNFSVDTIQNVYRKIVFSRDTKNGVTGIYLAKTNGTVALSMFTSNLTAVQQKTVLKIFKTGRLKIQ